MEFRQNDQLRLATEFVQFTNKNIFLTGKAGTGKTTFLHNLKKITPKRMVVVAPTGVAAINAGGVTIHSFFQLNFGPNIPESFRSQVQSDGKEGFKRKFHREKINLIKCIDLLVIDEVSMVRADVLDAIDEVLRQYRERSKPFGGVQLLMIGDLHQLSPVVKDEEWEILREFYPSAYFFDSIALRNSRPIILELKENFRQSDERFIALLNKVRESEISRETIETLNSRHIPGFEPKEEEGYIILTTHNATANEINQNRLKAIRNTSYFFKAEIKDEFPSYNYPTDPELELKVKSQVMFIKNDPSPQKLFYNGKIGKITRIEEGSVFVKCPADTEEIEVEKLIWENMRYSVNPETKEIKEEIAGTFSQIPLRLAWAITIHKSQGLTFDKVMIDANAAFAYGQVYVALSRCRTFEGIVLRTPIPVSGIKTDTMVQHFATEARKNEPDSDKLHESKFLFQKELIFELFDFKTIRSRLEHLIRQMKEHSNTLDTVLINDLDSRRNQFETELFQVLEKFRAQMNYLMATTQLPEENQTLQERITKGAAYISEKTSAILQDHIFKLRIDTDNQAVKKQLTELLEKLQKELFIRQAGLKACLKGFETIAYLKARSNAELDFRPPAIAKSKAEKAATGDFPHPELYAELTSWRDMYAEEYDLPQYMILPQKSIRELLQRLPVTIRELNAVKGLGPAKIRQFGAEIISIIRTYCEDHQISAAQPELPEKKKKTQGDSMQISYNLFMAGSSIGEIAKKRGLAVSTIESHLTHFATTGVLPVTKLISEEKLKMMSRVISEHPEATLSDLKNMLGETASYFEIRLARGMGNW